MRNDVKITGEILLRRARGNDLFVVAEPITVVWRAKTITVPIGAVVNGASIPYLLRWLLPKWHHDYDMASIVHDFVVGENGRLPTMRWKDAAVLFADIMELQGAPVWKVRLFKFAILKYRYIKRFL